MAGEQDCKPCPVCGHPPTWHPSGAKESIGCNWEDQCPREGSFDFQTPYLTVEDAVRQWNAAVAAY